MTWHQWHHTAPRLSSTNLCSLAAAWNTSCDQSRHWISSAAWAGSKPNAKRVRNAARTMRLAKNPHPSRIFASRFDNRRRLVEKLDLGYFDGLDRRMSRFGFQLNRQPKLHDLGAHRRR